MQLTTGSHGWLSYIASPDWLEEANAIRAARDQRYGNLYVENQSDERWVGDLGEIAFDHWLRENGVDAAEWLREDTAGRADFIVGNCQIDVKTVKRKVAPRQDYTAQISAKHKDYPANQLFFISYEIPKKKLWLLGGVNKEEFIRFARYYGEGEWVHSNYQIRRGHEIYNGSIARLITPEEWITLLKQGKL